uniref:Madanin 2 n=1 Tax=Hyalomma rufipes TaxID=72862 RepID=E2J6T8_HYARU
MSKMLAVILLAAIVAEIMEAKPNLQSRTGSDDDDEYDMYESDGDSNEGNDNDEFETAVPRLPNPNSGRDSEHIPMPVN